MLTGVLGSYDPTRHRIRTTAAVTALLAAALAGPPMVSAATTPAVNGTSLAFTGDGAGDTLVIGESGGLLTQSVNGATASTDFGGGTTLPANNTINTVVNAGGGDDTMTSDPAVTTAMLLNGGTGADSLQGGGGADLIQAGEDADTLTGGPGPDRLVGDLSVECPAAEAGGCIGTVTLTTAKPVEIGSQRTIAVLGSARDAAGNVAVGSRAVSLRLAK